MVAAAESKCAHSHTLPLLVPIGHYGNQTDHKLQEQQQIEAAQKQRLSIRSDAHCTVRIATTNS
jgi:hypothetical protein